MSYDYEWCSMHVRGSWFCFLLLFKSVWFRAMHAWMASIGKADQKTTYQIDEDMNWT